ncbi:MAG: hypothetical protein RIB79_10860 [Allomuricauda sp.]
MSNCTSSHQATKIEKATVEKIKKLDKKSIIKMGQNILKQEIGENAPDFYEQKVYANASSVLVQFQVPLKFAALNSNYYYGASIELISKSLTLDPIFNSDSVSNGLDYLSFYRPTKSDHHSIEDILHKINSPYKSIRKIWRSLIDQHERLTIIEKENYYEIESLSQHQSSRFKLMKGSGETLDHSHRHLKSQTMTEMGYFEIKK